MHQPIGHSDPFAGDQTERTNRQKAAYLAEFDTVTNGERAIVFAQLATADVLQGFLDFVKAQDAEAADELRQTGPCGNPTWLHDSADCPCKTKTAGV